MSIVQQNNFKRKAKSVRKRKKILFQIQKESVCSKIKELQILILMEKINTFKITNL